MCSDRAIDGDFMRAGRTHARVRRSFDDGREGSRSARNLNENWIQIAETGARFYKGTVPSGNEINDSAWRTYLNLLTAYGEKKGGEVLRLTSQLKS